MVALLDKQQHTPSTQPDTDTDAASEVGTVGKLIYTTL